MDARTIEHMRLANAPCRFVEIAEEQAGAAQETSSSSSR
jgi:hypothetical protein